MKKMLKKKEKKDIHIWDMIKFTLGLFLVISAFDLNGHWIQEVFEPKGDSSLAKKDLNSNPTIEGIILVDDESNLLSSQQSEEICGVYFAKNLCIPGRPKALKDRLSCFLGEPMTQERLQEIKQVIFKHYEKNNDPFVVITIPPQKMQIAAPQFVVAHSKIGVLAIEGNRYFCKQLFKDYLSTSSGETLCPIQMQEDLSFMNRNPFRNASLVLSPGEERGTTDLSLMVQDRRPVRFYVGADNTGIPTIQRQRLFEGINASLVMGFLDQIFNIQHTSSYNFKTFDAWTGQYVVLFPWKHVLDIYGGFSKLHYRMRPVSSVMSRNEGQASQASIRYQIPFIFLSSPNAKQQISIGFDFKNTDNTIFYSDLFDNFGQYVNLSQFYIGYNRVYSFSSFQIDGSVELFWSPGKMLSHQSKAAFQSLRPGAQNHWVYGRLYLKYLQMLPKKYSLFFWFRGQLSSQNLLPNEQVGIGGYDTVRGYNERQYNSDSGLLLSFELHSPPLPLFSNIRCAPKDAIEFLVFSDYGYGWNHIPLPGEPKTDFLLSVGPGLRYALPPYITARLDWGIKLHNQAIFGGGSTMLHFSGIFAF